MTTLDGIFVEIEKLSINSRRAGAMAEQRRWMQGLLDLCRLHPDGKITKEVVAKFINDMIEEVE